MTRTRVTLLTVGDPSRVTGCYLFHRRLAERAPANGAETAVQGLGEAGLNARPVSGAARVEALGGTATSEANDMPWGQRVAHIKGPDGNVVNLTQQL